MPSESWNGPGPEEVVPLSERNGEVAIGRGAEAALVIGIPADLEGFLDLTVCRAPDPAIFELCPVP